MPVTDPKKFLLELFDAAISAVQPRRCMPVYMPKPPKGRTVVIGAGKASSGMAAEFEKHWARQSNGELSGLVITRYGHSVDCKNIEIVEAGHPVPDAAGLISTERILEMVGGLTSDDLVVCLLSGGGSSLLSAPALGLSLEDKQALCQVMLKSGVNISEFNTVRKHLSAVKGGLLAKACMPARLCTLAISDVVGNSLTNIASGPTVADPSTFADARAVVGKYGLNISKNVEFHLFEAAHETLKPNDPAFIRTTSDVIATGRQALEAAAIQARSAGVMPIIMNDSIEGESKKIGEFMAGVTIDQGEGPFVLLSGGETTVKVEGQGRGGPNAEFMLSLGLNLIGYDNVYAIACDTDGSDGTEDNAGAILMPDMIDQSEALGLDAQAMLADNDSYGFFQAVDGLVVTGPTQTNVSDFRAVLVL